MRELNIPVQSHGGMRAKHKRSVNGEKVARETQYFADPFVAPASRAQWVERIDT
jgi:hypothetical protein